MEGNGTNSTFSRFLVCKSDRLVITHFFSQDLVPTKISQHITFKSQDTEADTRCVLQKKVFLETLQNAQENTCVRVSFLKKLQDWGLQLY